MMTMMMTMARPGTVRCCASVAALVLACWAGSTLGAVQTKFVGVPAASCVPDVATDWGCINGVGFNRSEQYVCGVQETSGRQPIYLLADTGCCHTGTRFDIADQNCCYGEVHNDSDGKCTAWDPSFPTKCYCDKSEESGMPLSTEAPMERRLAPIGKLLTWPPNSAPGACVGANSTNGCLNGFTYQYSSQYSCGDYLLDFQTFGCCMQQPYNLITETCCNSNGVYSVKSGHACTCNSCVH